MNSNGTVQWDINGRAICIEEYNQYYYQICSDGTGGAIIKWQDHRNGESDIYAQKINSNGIVQWGLNGMAICTIIKAQTNPQICTDGAGGAIITWESMGNLLSLKDIYAQRINSNGDPHWGVDGITISEMEYNQHKLQICSDGVGGAIITWQDWSDTHAGYTNSDIYARKIKNVPPISNHPVNIITSTTGSQTINWTLYDDSGGENIG